MSQIDPYRFTTESALEVKNDAEDICIRGQFPRGDYSKLLELTTHILGGVIRRRREVNKDAQPQVIAFRMKCLGVLHNARFKAKAIYSIKMFMTLPQFIKKAPISVVQKRQIKRMAMFVILLYGKYFLQMALKLLSAIFYQIFTSHQMITLQKI